MAGEIAAGIRGDHGFVVLERRRKIAQPLGDPSQLEREQIRVEAVGPCSHQVEIAVARSQAPWRDQASWARLKSAHEDSGRSATAAS